MVFVLYPFVMIMGGVCGLIAGGIGYRSRLTPGLLLRAALLGGISCILASLFAFGMRPRIGFPILAAAGVCGGLLAGVKLTVLGGKR